MTRVLIGTPSGIMMHAATALSIHAAVTEFSKAGIDAGWSIAEGTYPGTNQDRLARVAFVNNVDFLLLIDSDMAFPPPLGVALFHQRDNFDIMAVPYRARQAPHPITAMRLDETPFARDATGVEEVLWCATGFMLIPIRVLEVVPAPRFPLGVDDDGEQVGNDVMFCAQARMAGFKIGVDLDLARSLKHLGTFPIGWEWP